MQSKIIVGAIVGLVVISGIVFLLYQQQESQPLEQEYEPSFGDTPFDEEELKPIESGGVLDECGSQGTQYLRDLCWLFLAGDELDASKCLNIVERSARIDCIRGVAKAFESEATTKELEACAQLLAPAQDDEDLAADNLGRFYDCLDAIEPTLKEDKLAICNRYLADDEPQLYMCHSEIARELLDYSICDAMPTSPNNYMEHCIWILDSEVA
jgi:hypothetical protein